MDAPQRPDLSVVIVNYRCRELLRACLNSIPAASGALRTEIIVVDNASGDGSAAMVRREFPSVKLIPSRRNLGFTKGNNAGFRIAEGRHVLMLNNDTEAMPGAFEEAVAALDADRSIGAAGLMLLNSDRTLQLSCRRFPSFQQALFNRESLLTRLFPGNPFSASYLMTDLPRDRASEVDWVSGACLLVRREVLNAIGHLDERFFMYSEDVDFCYRVWLAGWRVVYLPQARVVHHIGRSSSVAGTRPIVERHRSMYRFYKKHYSQEILFLDMMTAAVVWARCGMQLALRRLRAGAAS